MAHKPIWRIPADKHFADTKFYAQSTLKNIRRFYGKVTGNQLPVHFPLFFTGARKHFQESGTER